VLKSRTERKKEGREAILVQEQQRAHTVGTPFIHRFVRSAWPKKKQKKTCAIQRLFFVSSENVRVCGVLNGSTSRGNLTYTGCPTEDSKEKVGVLSLMMGNIMSWVAMTAA